MAVVNGLNGSVTFAGVAIETNVTEWSIDFEGAEIDVTSMASSNDWNEFIGGRKGWGGSFSVNWDSAASEVITSSTGLADTAASLELTFFTGATITGNAIITGCSGSVNIDDANKLTYTFRGTAAPTWTAA